MARTKNTGRKVQNPPQPPRIQGNSPNTGSRRPDSNATPAAEPGQRGRSQSKAKQTKDRDQNANNDTTAAPGTGSARSAQTHQTTARASKPSGLVAKHFHQKNQQDRQPMSQQSPERGIREEDQEDDQDDQDRESDNAQREENKSDGGGNDIGEEDSNADQRNKGDSSQSNNDPDSSDQNDIDEDDTDISLSDSQIEERKEEAENFARELTTSEDVNLHISRAERTLESLNQEETKEPLSTRDETKRELTAFKLRQLQNRRSELSKAIAATRREGQAGSKSADEPETHEEPANKTKNKDTVSAPRKTGRKRKGKPRFTLKKKTHAVKKPAQTWDDKGEKPWPMRGIVAKHTSRNGEVQYKIRWLGYDKDGKQWKDRWESASGVTEDAIADWEARRKKKGLRNKVDKNKPVDYDEHFKSLEKDGAEGDKSNDGSEEGNGVGDGDGEGNEDGALEG